MAKKKVKVKEDINISIDRILCKAAKFHGGCHSHHCYEQYKKELKELKLSADNFSASLILLADVIGV